MKADQRRTALHTLPSHVQAALVLFMETMQNTTAADLVTLEPASDPVPSVTKSSAVSGIAATTDNMGNASSTYKAHVHIKALRFYTHGHDEYKLILDQQMILVQMRQVLSAASLENPWLWEEPEKVRQICLTVFEANGTSEDDMGLSAFIYLRAGHWLPQNCTITSPVMPLAEVLQLHCRLLRARRTSWQALRAEWVQLMQCKRHPKAKRKSLVEAETIADAARASALKIQLERAAACACRALHLEELQNSRRHRVLVQRQLREARRVSQAKNRAAVVERQAMKAREEAWKKRQRWSRRSDLTIDDIMQGSPS